MEAQNITLVVALVAGLLSFFSPCVLPLVPVYLCYMTGAARCDLDGVRRPDTLIHALLFVLGFSFIFVALGATAGLLGSLIYPAMPIIVRVGGVLLIVFGLHMTGLISIPLLNMEKRFDLQGGGRRSYWTSLFIGIVFAAGWTPCVGPVLSAILVLAADSQTVSTGALLLSVYALGMGLPFLVAAGLINLALPALSRMGRYFRAVSVAGGILLMVMGLLLLTGWFNTLIFWLNGLLTPI